MEKKMEAFVSAELMLESTEPSLLIIEERKRKDIVVGVPHHAPAGIPTLPCLEHPDADENAGFIGRNLAERLNCCSIIACNYTSDVNKYLRSDYTMQIACWKPQVLIEIHGHGGKAAIFDIEISSGSSNNDKFSTVLAEKLLTFFAPIADLKKFSVSGEYDKINFKAKKALTITDGNWLPYHIELPAKIRMPENRKTGKPAEIGYKFCELLANAVQEIHGV
jgi:hypothetical protein